MALGLIPQLLGYANHDVAWFAHVAERVLEGDRLYADLVETNPPLIIWLHLPLALIGKLLSVRAIDLQPFFVLILWLGSAAASLRLIEPGREVAEARTSFLLLFAFVGLVLPFPDFGQREHLMLLLVAPYLVGLSRCAQGRFPRRTGLRLAVATAAGVGLVLKPHFLALWLAGEAWLAFRTKARRSVIFRLENRVILGVLVLYAAAVLVLAPEYLAQSRELAAVYLRFGRLPHWASPAVVVGPLALLVMMARRQSASRAWKDRAEPLAVALVAFLFIGFVQAKGWRYHFFPAFAAALVLLAFCARPTRPVAPAAHHLVRVGVRAIPVLATLTFAVVAARELGAPLDGAYPSSVTREGNVQALERTLRGEGRSPGSVAVLTSRLQLFSAVTAVEARWELSIPCLWFLPPLYPRQQFPGPVIDPRGPAEMSEVERRFFDAVVDDLVDARPELILVDYSRSERMSFQGRAFPYLEYYCRDPRFRRLLERYEVRRGEERGFLGLTRAGTGAASASGRVCPPTDGVA